MPHMKTRLAAVVSAAFIAAGMTLAATPPAHAQANCAHSEPVLRVTTYTLPGYCGYKGEWALSIDGGCHNMLNGWRNTTDSLVNYHSYPVRIYSGLYCTGPGYTLGSGNSHPRLANTAVGGNDAESMRLCVPGGRC